MKILDPGHIYVVDQGPRSIQLKFVKRSGGAVHYVEEWPGVQTQAVMRMCIDYVKSLMVDQSVESAYSLWQLGASEDASFHLSSVDQLVDLLDIMIDRSIYLNSIIPCVETSDACEWLSQAKLSPVSEDSIAYIRMALWCYEARAYRRKVESVNRKQPTHDDTSRPRPWRDLVCDDVPFCSKDIELRPIGDDGHILLN